MAMPERNRGRYNKLFRLKRKPQISFMGFIGKAPTQVRYDNNPPQMLEVGFGVQDLKGLLIEETGVRKTLYLVGSFLDLFSRINYRVYEVTSYVTLVRELKKIHPVTKNEVSLGFYRENIWIQEEPIETRVETGLNPTQKFNIRSDVELKERDQVGNYLVRNVYLENNLWLAQCEFNVKDLPEDLNNIVFELQDGSLFELQTGETFKMQGEI